MKPDVSTPDLHFLQGFAFESLATEAEVLLEEMRFRNQAMAAKILCQDDAHH
jgi:hypothetical protein